MFLPLFTCTVMNSYVSKMLSLLHEFVWSRIFELIRVSGLQVRNFGPDQLTGSII